MDEVVSNSINFAGYPDSESFIKLCNLVTPQLNTFSKSGKIILYIVGVGLCVVAAVTAYAANNVSVFFEIIIPIILLVCVLVGLLKLTNKQVIRSQRVNYEKSVQKEPRTGSISISGIFFKIVDGKTELKWTHFDRLVEIDGAFALCKQLKIVDAFSYSMFESKESFEAARKIALEKVKGVH
jgi:hypothetical protein